MAHATLTLLNGLSHGLMLFMLSAGLTLIFSMMGVLNFAHASFYMLGAYLGHAIAGWAGFGAALLLAPLLVGALGCAFEALCLRRVHRHGHVPELLITFGLSYVLLELVQLVWGRGPVVFAPPPWLQGALLTLIDVPGQGLSLRWGDAPSALCAAPTVCSPFPATRGFMMVMALLTLLVLSAWLRLTRTGLILRAALTHPAMAQALGHNVPRVFMQVFGAGAALAALAGVMGGSTFVTEPGMAANVGAVIFAVVVVGGLGSLSGAFIVSLLLGVLQTAAVGVDAALGALPGGAWLPAAVQATTVAQWAPLLPFALMVAVLVARPRGLMGRRDA